MNAAPISRQELFERLAAGHAAGISVVTPNLRLARELAREFDRQQIASGLAVWETADILPLGAFIERTFDDAAYAERSGELPLPLTAAQEIELWRQAIADSAWAGELLAAEGAAAQCADAWRLAQAWRIDGALGSWPGNEDAQAFAGWSRAYLRRCAREGHTDGARLPDLAAALLKEQALGKPKLLVAYAFDIVPPQAGDFFGACAGAGIEVRTCAPARKQGSAVRLAFSSAREELEAAAQWARARLDSGAARIGVVVPELGERRKEVARVFARAMQPGFGLPGVKRSPLPFNVSLGVPLADVPIADAALGILELAAGAVEFARASRLVRSPFLGGADSEMGRRARLDARLREHLPARLTLARLLGAIEDCPVLRQRLEALFALAKENLSGQRSPHDWGRQVSALLEAAGFPGERALDSEEYQARAKLNETLGELAKLERVAPRMTYAQALARLRRLCAEALFQPESEDAPIQVLGILESAGLEFDHLWLSGLTDEAWPLAARPNPFIAPALQRKAGIPEASADTSLALDRRRTGHWLAAADEVVLSHALREADRELAPSPLIAAIAQGEVEIPVGPSYRDALHARRVLETVTDGAAPSLGDSTLRGGTRVLADQAACPFRAFARHRLGADPLETPAPALDAADRGKLLHDLMRRIWGELGSKAGLDAAAPEALAAIIDKAAEAAVARLRGERPGAIEDRFALLERERLTKLALEWLEVERGRAPFEVVAREEKRMLEVAGLSLAGRIDRMDRLEGGGGVLIDYKSGKVAVQGWLGARPEDPQLPLYALAAGERIDAVAFAKLKTGEMRFDGLARAADLLPRVDTVERHRTAKKYAASWSELLDGWRQELDALGRGFVAGDARVDPKDLFRTCERCDLQPLCRVYERYRAPRRRRRRRGGA